MGEKGANTKKRGMSELLTPRMGSVDEKDTR